MRTTVVVVVFFVMAAAQARAQELLRQSLIDEQDTSKTSTLGFERSLNTFLWNGRLAVKQSVGGMDVRFRQRARSRFIKTEQRSIQDEYATNFDVAAPLSERWRFAAHILSTGLSDNRALDLGRLAQHRALSGIEFTPRATYRVKLLGGYQFDSQESEQDRGFSYVAEAEGSNIVLEEFRASVRSKWAQAFLTPRRPSQGSLDVRLERDFGLQARNTLGVAYNRLRREFYTPAEEIIQERYHVRSNIFKREAEVIEVSNQLEYQLGSGSRLIMRGGVLNRIIDRSFRYKNLSNPLNIPLDTRIQEFQLNGTLSISSELAAWLMADVSLSYHEREERHTVKEEEGVSVSLLDRQERAERRLENISERTSLSSVLRAQLSEKDRLTFGGSASILRYDTPDTLNVDDRDELLVTIGVQEQHRFNEYLMLTLSVDATLSHLVYLSRFQSANNNWNRVLRFSPKIEYTPSSWFRSTNIAEVLANYTVYDFEEQVALVRSFSFRQAAWSDSTSIRFSQWMSVDFVGGVRVYERGILRWKEFKERPQNYFVEQSYWPRLIWMNGTGIRLGVGFRYFGQNRYRSEGSERSLERRLVSAGPTVELDWIQNDVRMVSLVGWRETQLQDGAEVRTLSNLSLKLSMVL